MPRRRPKIVCRAGPCSRDRFPRLLAFGLAAAALLTSSSSRAELSEEVLRIVRGWTRHGVRVAHVGTVYLHEGERRAMAVPSPGPSDGSCQSFIALGERHVRFSLRPGDGRAGPTVAGDDDDESAAGQARPSRAGVAALSACGAARAPWRDVELAMQSAGGALELLVARHDGGLPSFDEVVPERALGFAAGARTLGRPRRQAPLAARVRRTAAAARLDGAAAVVPVNGRANAEGAGALGLNLPAGCHRLSVLADESTTAPLDDERDLDGEVRFRGSQAALRQDRSHAPDARLEFCLGETRQIDLRFVGAGGAVDVVALAARWPLPRAAAVAGDPAGRAAFAWALFRRRAPEPREPSVLRVRGGPGATAIPVSVEPGACYLAVMALTTGQAGAVRLSAVTGERTVRDQSTEQPLGAAVTFCAKTERHALLRAELRAGFGWWLMGLWRLAGAAP